MMNPSATVATQPALDGVLNVAKPSGWTSHDVVEKLRRTLGIRKVGHAGTLDPMATGVLPLLLGKGTRLSEYLIEWDKEYEAVMRLGQVTDTQDATGSVIQERSVSGITEEAIRTTLRQFEGLIQQVPPMYSALKVDGRPLYKMARAGKTVPRNPRPITIHELTLLKVDLPDVLFRMTCSKGTYVRTLCADIGEVLGVGGHLHQLCRTRVGPFHIQDAVSPLEINNEFRFPEKNQAMWGLDSVLNHLPEVVIDSLMVSRALNGAPIPQSSVSGPFWGDPSEPPPGQEILRVKDPLGQLLGLGKFKGNSHDSQGSDQSLVLVKVFAQSSEVA